MLEIRQTYKQKTELCVCYMSDQADVQTADGAVCLLSTQMCLLWQWSGRRTYIQNETELCVCYRSYQADVHTEDGAVCLLYEWSSRRAYIICSSVAVIWVIRQTHRQKTELCVCYMSEQADVRTEDRAVCLLSEWSSKRTYRICSSVAVIGVIRQTYIQKTELCGCYMSDQADVHTEDGAVCLLS